MIIKKAAIVILLLLSFSISSVAQARITVTDTNKVKPHITSLLFGNFFEFLKGLINGEYGLWAQELNNRGFDMVDYDGQGTSYFWNVFNPQNSNVDAVRLYKGGYNENGKYFQRIIKYSTQELFGISQTVYVYDTVGGNFYIYLRTKTKTHQAKLVLPVQEL